MYDCDRCVTVCDITLSSNSKFQNKKINKKETKKWNKNK